MITGADVVAFRQRRHFSRKQLATETGLTEGKIWRIENKNTIHPDERQALERLGVTSTVVDGEPIARPEPVTPVALLGVHTPVTVPPPPAPTKVAEPPPIAEVDLAALSAIAQRSYSHYFSNSELQTFKRCRRKWWLAWYRGLHLKVESPVGVRQIGNRGHRALKEHYTPGGPPHADHLLEVLERLILEDRSLAAHQSMEADDWKQFEDEANLERIMLEGYLAWIAETGMDSELEIVAPETYLEAGLEEFGEDEVAIIGKLDVRVRRTTDGAILFIDHKFVGNLTQPVLMLTLDEQMLHYHLLESLNSAGQHVAGALYNMLRRVKRTIRATPPFYSRVEVRHNSLELESYRRRIVGLIDDILRVRATLNNTAHSSFAMQGGVHSVVYPSPRRECTWDCPFFAVCPMFDDGSRAEDMLKTYYDVGDPHEYYMTEMIGVTE